MTSLFANCEQTLCPLILQVARSRLAARLRHKGRNLGMRRDAFPDSAMRLSSYLLGSGRLGLNHG
jgi:hypothetical protein